MAAIGDILSYPEEGWIRIDDTDKNIQYIGDNWKCNNNSVFYGGTITGVQYCDETHEIKFAFIGSKIRIISSKSSSRGVQCISIDGMPKEEYSCYMSPTVDSSYLLYEKKGLQYGKHYVSIKVVTGNFLSIDCIDIDNNGCMVPYNQSIDDFPIKVGSEDNVANYASSLIEGEEQLLITREGNMYLSDGKGGYTVTGGGIHSNINILNGLSETDTGELLYNDAPVKGQNGENGKDGKDAYQTAIDLGFIGTENEWLQSLRGPEGKQGPQGIRGDRGEDGVPFKIVKSYDSIVKMNDDFNNEDILINDFVMINTEDVNDEDNAKLFIKGELKFEFVTDLSGAVGIQGPKGDRGDKGQDGYTPIKGVDYFDGKNGSDLYGNNYYTKTETDQKLNSYLDKSTGGSVAKNTYFKQLVFLDRPTGDSLILRGGEQTKIRFRHSTKGDASNQNEFGWIGCDSTQSNNFSIYGMVGDVFVRSLDTGLRVGKEQNGVRAVSQLYPGTNLGSSSNKWQNIYGKVTYSTTGAVNTSDARLKENIVRIDGNAKNINTDTLTPQDCYDFVKNDLSFCTYDWIEGNIEGLKTNIGFLAQDIQDSNPKMAENLVIEGEENLSYSSTNFNNIIAIALQEAMKKIEILENKLLEKQ